MKYKYGIVFLVYFVFCAADWLFANIPIINALSTGYFTEYDIFMNLHTSLNGYSGLQEIMVVYTPSQQGGTRVTPLGTGWALQTPGPRWGRPISSLIFPDMASQAQFR